MSDYISRVEARNCITGNEFRCRMIQSLDSIPSADVRENIHGKWERMSDLPEDKDDRYKCSNCGTIVHYSNRVNLYHFNSWCGRCGSLNNSLMAQLSGADMRGE